MNVQFKKIDRNDYAFLKEMLYDALFVPEGDKPFPKTIVDMPEISKYIDNWGNNGDIGVIVQKDNEFMGAVWGRLFKENNKGYGFIDKGIPEITMAIIRKYRNLGFGTKLLTNFFKVAQANGIKALSLSVDKRNRALIFYQRMGFEIVDEFETAYTMKKEL